MYQETGLITFCVPQAYRLISRPRGLALILSNVHFSGEKDLEFRSGGDVDHAALQKLFEYLGYQVFVRHDQTAQVSLENRTSMMNACILSRCLFLRYHVSGEMGTGPVSVMKMLV